MSSDNALSPPSQGVRGVKAESPYGDQFGFFVAPDERGQGNAVFADGLAADKKRRRNKPTLSCGECVEGKTKVGHPRESPSPESPAPKPDTSYTIHNTQ